MNQEAPPATKRCPFCAEEILAEALKCKHCGEWLTARPAPAAAPPAVAPPAEKRNGNGQALWRLLLLSVCTFNVYNIYWFYRSWKHFRDLDEPEIRPGWRTLGLLVPIYGLVLIHRLFTDIRDHALAAGCPTYSSPVPLTVGYIIANALSFSLGFGGKKQTSLLGPVGEMALTFVLVVATASVQAVAQRTLNLFWKEKQPEWPMKTSFSGGEITLVVLGVCFWGLVLIGTLMPQ